MYYIVETVCFITKVKFHLYSTVPLHSKNDKI